MVLSNEELKNLAQKIKDAEAKGEELDEETQKTINEFLQPENLKESIDNDPKIAKWLTSDPIRTILRYKGVADKGMFSISKEKVLCDSIALTGRVEDYLTPEKIKEFNPVGLKADEFIDRLITGKLVYGQGISFEKIISKYLMPHEQGEAMSCLKQFKNEFKPKVTMADLVARQNNDIEDCLTTDNIEKFSLSASDISSLILEVGYQKGKEMLKKYLFDNGLLQRMAREEERIPGWGGIDEGVIIPTGLKALLNFIKKSGIEEELLSDERMQPYLGALRELEEDSGSKKLKEIVDEAGPIDPQIISNAAKAMEPKEISQEEK